MVGLDVVIYGFALASCASGIGALVWIIYDLRRRVPVLESLQSTTANALRSCAAKLATVEKLSTEKHSTALLARVDALDEAVGKLADTHRKFAGRMDRRYQLDRGASSDDPDADVEDPTWRALRAAQAVQPGEPRR